MILVVGDTFYVDFLFFANQVYVALLEGDGDAGVGESVVNHLLRTDGSTIMFAHKGHIPRILPDGVDGLVEVV